ncbi:MAG: hypothetical protein M3065_19400, partial [Actinomycetota bacterium]|nr:hypothetical protein [Actinomycetota bacterium]
MARLLEERRLVTLTGPPGIGKSRIALEVASGRADGGAALVELAPIGDPELVPHAVAAALSVQEAPGHTLIEALVARLRRNSLLLVLDNCEHLVAACAEVIDELLCACPGLRVLATSREALSITGELVWQVPGLAVPAPDSELRPDALMDYDGVRLFVERARAVVPQFVLSGEVAPAVAEIARRLDGIPLAIELAAARAEMLTPPEIAERLDNRFALLTKGSRSDLSRHQTLQAALDWSHELLSAPERALLRRLSVFVGGFYLEAARAVCACAELGDTDVFDLLAQLVAKSLVVADSTTNVSGRYRLLETLRSYAGDRLDEAGESAPLREAHACFYLALAERAEPELTGAEQAHWFERLETEHGNVRGGLDWSLRHGERE